VIITGLLEKKGIHPSGSNTGAALETDDGKEADTGSSPAGKEKRSLKDKIKEKLHRSSAS
jgi:hypothetical protein